MSQTSSAGNVESLMEERSDHEKGSSRTGPIDLQGQKILFVAYFYPPVFGTGLPGAMRTVKFIRNLTNGECHVLTTHELEPTADASSALDHLPLPINGEYIHRAGRVDLFGAALNLRQRLKRLLSRRSVTSAANTELGKRAQFKSESNDKDTRSALQKIKDFIYDLFYFPDQAAPWILPAVIRGRKLVRQRDIDVIFATGSPWSGLIVGYLISRLTGKPLIADFRDPWMNNPFHQSKGRMLDGLASRLEQRVVRYSRWVSLNTDALHDEFVRRYPNLDHGRFVVMPNGFDPDDFEDLHADATATQESEPDRWITLIHAGFLYGPRDPKALLLALRKANLNITDNARKIRFIQIGELALDYKVEEEFSDLLEQGQLVLEPQKPYRECLNRMAAADVLVNIQPGTKTQVPSKLYDYLALNRPILNITTSDGALGKMVQDYGFGRLVGLSDTRQLVDYLVVLRTKPGKRIADYPLREKFHVRKITSDLALLFTKSVQ